MSPTKNSMFSKISNFLGMKKDKIMSTTETIIETIEEKEPRKFQWKKGDNFGFTVILESEDDEMFYFTDGSRIFKAIQNEFLEEIINGELPFPPSNQFAGIEPQITKHQAPQPIAQPAIQAQPEVSPLEKLIIKLSSKNVETIDLSIGINLPKKEVFSMLLENSDETRDEMISAISQIVTSQIQIDKLQSYINQEVINYLNNYYE
jgi:hypothetical protein